MPKQKTKLSDEERGRRLRATAREVGADASGKEFERVFTKIVRPKASPRMGKKGR
jgi:hypothetical protein